jgi:ribosomal-protein-alanine N-acetyltransferase
MTIQIRPLSQEDIHQIMAIELQSYTSPWTERMFKSELQFKGYNYSQIAFDDEKRLVIGYCFFWLLPEDEVHIHNICVHPDFRRQGIAQKLIQSCVDLGNENDTTSIILEVRESNLPAQSLYQRMGFECIGRRLKYYLLPEEDALIMRLLLK